MFSTCIFLFYRQDINAIQKLYMEEKLLISVPITLSCGSPQSQKWREFMLLLFLALVLNLEQKFCKGPQKIFSWLYHMTVCYSLLSFQNAELNCILNIDEVSLFLKMQWKKIDSALDNCTTKLGNASLCRVRCWLGLCWLGFTFVFGQGA